MGPGLIGEEDSPAGVSGLPGVEAHPAVFDLRDTQKLLAGLEHRAGDPCFSLCSVLFSREPSSGTGWHRAAQEHQEEPDPQVLQRPPVRPRWSLGVT